jgi:hypothetical protein
VWRCGDGEGGFRGIARAQASVRKSTERRGRGATRGACEGWGRIKGCLKLHTLLHYGTSGELERAGEP